MRLEQYLVDDNDEFKTELLKNSQRFHEHFISLDEIFDKDILLYSPTWDGIYFTVKFNVNGQIYTFKAKENSPGEFSVMFFVLGVDILKLQGNKKYVGDVFSGVLKSLQLLIDEKKVTSFYFNTNELKLISLYDKMSKYVERKFKDYKFIKSVKKKGMKFWIFKRN